jgi:hypothetical protein
MKAKMRIHGDNYFSALTQQWHAQSEQLRGLAQG